MKIVIATAVYYPQINGVAVFSHNLARGLLARGLEVLVICPSQTGRSYTQVVDGVKMCYLKSVGVKVYPDQIHKVPKKRKMFYKHGFRVSVFPKREVRRALADFQPDVVHLNNIQFHLTPSVILETEKYRKDTGRAVKIIYTAQVCV